MRHWSISIIVQRDATRSNLFIILQVHSTYFSVQLPPSNVATLEGGSCTKKIWPGPEAVVTVLCTPDDGCGWYPKHVEWIWRKINRLLYVASHWTIINIYSVELVTGIWRYLKLMLAPWNELSSVQFVCAVAQWLRCCATNRKVVGSIPAGVFRIFHWHTILPIALWPLALGSTQPLTEMSTRSIS